MLFRSDGTAFSPTNYVGVTNVLTFAPGQTSSNISLTILDDAVVNADRIATLILTNVASVPSGSASIGVNSNAALTIMNDDFALAFSAATYSVSESAGSQTITVVRTGVTNTTASVSYATANGTAIEGLHYLGASGTLTFTSGVTSLTFTVPVIDNDVTNAPRTVLLSLFNFTGPFGLIPGKIGRAHV